MNSIFGIGLAELVLILLLAALLFGPQHIRQIAYKLGLFMAQVQKLFLQFRRGMERELSMMDTPEMREALKELRELQAQVEDLQQQVRGATHPAQSALLSQGRYAQSPSLYPEGRRDWARLPDYDPAMPSISPPPNLPKLVDVPEDPDPQV